MGLNWIYFPCVLYSWRVSVRETWRSWEWRIPSFFSYCPAWSRVKVGPDADWIPGRRYGRKCSTYSKYVNYSVVSSSEHPLSLAEITEWLDVWAWKGGREPAEMAESPGDKPKNWQQIFINMCSNNTVQWLLRKYCYLPSYLLQGTYYCWGYLVFAFVFFIN